LFGSLPFFISPSSSSYLRLYNIIQSFFFLFFFFPPSCSSSRRVYDDTDKTQHLPYVRSCVCLFILLFLSSSYIGTLTSLGARVSSSVKHTRNTRHVYFLTGRTARTRSTRERFSRYLPRFDTRQILAGRSKTKTYARDTPRKMHPNLVQTWDYRRHRCYRCAV